MNIKPYTIITFSDWYYYYGTSGKDGLHRICDVMKEAGMQRLYLRTHEGGKACYPSKIATTYVGKHALDDYAGYISYPKSYYNYVLSLDYAAWDPVALFPQATKSAGIEAGLWYTIMEDDHGGHVKSDFLLEHPHYRCIRRDGSTVEGCLEFFFQAVRDYKLKIVDELLDKGATRLLLDLVRRNGQPSADPDGYFQYGFNPEIVAAFKAQTGLDPHTLKPATKDWHAWVDFVAQPTTDFLIEVCRRIHARGAAVELMTWPVHLKQWMGIDLEKILDAGLVEAVHIQSQSYSYSPAELERQLDTLRPQVGSRNVRIIPGICGYEGIVPSGLDDYFTALETSQVSEVVVHESDVIPRCKLSDRFRALSFGQPHYRRQLHSSLVTSVDWNAVRSFKGFLRTFNEDSIEPDQLTEVQVAHTATDLHVRVTCHERDVSRLLPVPGWPDNYNVRILNARTFWNPGESIHLFISTPGQYNDFFHLVLDPSNRALQEQRINERWNDPWQHAVEIGSSTWTATFTIPFTTLGFTPTPGNRCPFQIVRAQANPLQITALNLTAPGLPSPDEYGFLNFK